MASLEERLRQLEALTAERPRWQDTPLRFKRLFAALEAHEAPGLENGTRVPIAAAEPYTAKDEAEDRDTLERTIPAYREESGWQSDEGRAFLDDWERKLRDKLEKEQKHG